MIRQLMLFLSACTLLALISCAGGSSALSIDPNANHPPAPGNSAPDVQDQSSRNTLSVRMPEISQLAAGAEFEVILSAQFNSELYQGSGRLAYNRQAIRPISAKRGAIPAGNVFAAKLDSPPATSQEYAGLDGIVPFAFTALPGRAGFGSNSGELLRVRFKLLASPGVQYPVALVNTPEYLQLRDAQGQRLSFDLSTEVAPK